MRKGENNPGFNTCWEISQNTPTLELKLINLENNWPWLFNIIQHCSTYRVSAWGWRDRQGTPSFSGRRSARTTEREKQHFAWALRDYSQNHYHQTLINIVRLNPRGERVYMWHDTMQYMVWPRGNYKKEGTHNGSSLTIRPDFPNVTFQTTNREV